MNNCTFTGRTTKDMELKQTNDGKKYCRFFLAVDRDYRKEDGSRDADFIPCLAWKKRAETMSEHIKKGQRIGINCHVRTGSYDGENGKVYTTDFVVDRFEFLDAKKDQRDPEFNEYQQQEMQQVDDDDLPF